MSSTCSKTQNRVKTFMLYVQPPLRHYKYVNLPLFLGKNLTAHSQYEVINGNDFNTWLIITLRLYFYVYLLYFTPQLILINFVSYLD